MDELTSSHSASSEEAEQSDASMLQRETNDSFRHSQTSDIIIMRPKVALLQDDE